MLREGYDEYEDNNYREFRGDRNKRLLVEWLLESSCFYFNAREVNNLGVI